MKQDYRLYRIWSAMKNRCERESYRNYKSYGGRGIKVCEEWSSFEVFERWALSHGYSDDLTIDRIDNDGNYEPNNCRWADRKTQDRNKQNSRFINHNGKLIQLSDFAEMYNIPKPIVSNRFDKGWSAERIINTPYQPRKYVRVKYRGKSVSLKELSELTGVKYGCIRARYYKGCSVAEMVM